MFSGLVFVAIAIVALLAIVYGRHNGDWKKTYEFGPWYQTMRKPPGNPPNQVFGIVWTILYSLIAAVGCMLLWNDHRNRNRSCFASCGQSDPDSEAAFFFYWLQWALNIIWTPIFVGLRRPGLALVTIILLDISVILLIVALWSFIPIAAILLVPYMIWLGIATYLNIGFIILNQ